MMGTYAHLNGEDIEREIFRVNGIPRNESLHPPAMRAKQCGGCGAVNAPTSRYWRICGIPIEG